VLFNSLPFLVFLAAVLAVNPRLSHRGQNRFLLLASYLFYGWWDWRFLSLLWFSTLLDYGVGRGLGATGAPGRRRLLLAASLTGNLGLLAVFKYFDFFAGSAAALLARLGLHADLPTLRVALPVGISFYTFQTLGYALDVYHRRLAPSRSLPDFALFVAFFPQLVAGPIERAARLLPQVAAPRRVTRRHVETGLALLVVGYFRKVAIADTLAPFVERAFAAPVGAPGASLLAGAYAFSLQIYGDFAGYSDIARGVARLLGFELMENFRAPYLSRSPAEFWRRWHVSLSNWIRDYVFTPLLARALVLAARLRAGSERRELALAYALAVVPTLALVGLWHGARWTFVAWGLWHGAWLAWRRAAGGGRAPRPWPAAWRARLPQIGRALLTFHGVAVAFVLFRAPDFAVAGGVLAGIVHPAAGWGAFPLHVLVAAAATLALDAAQATTGRPDWLADLRPWPRLALAQLLVAVTIAAAAFRLYANPPFIYFQF